MPPCPPRWRKSNYPSLEVQSFFSLGYFVSPFASLHNSLFPLTGSNAKEDILNKISRLDDVRGGLQKEITALNQKINAEKETIENLSEGLKKTEQSQGSLAREMREVQSRLSSAENEKADKDVQIKQMKEECQHQEELINKLNREKKSIVESKLKEEELIQVRVMQIIAMET